MKRPHSIKLTVAHIRHLWENECKHKEKYMKPTNPLTWNSDDCQDCFLAKIPWRPKLGYTRDLCFLIWHDKILEKKGGK